MARTRAQKDTKSKNDSEVGRVTRGGVAKTTTSKVKPKAQPKKKKLKNKSAIKITEKSGKSSENEEDSEPEIVERVLQRTNLTERVKKKMTTERFLVCDICDKEIYCKSGTGNLRLHRHRHHKKQAEKVEKTFNSIGVQTESLETIPGPVSPQPNSPPNEMPSFVPEPVTRPDDSCLSPEKPSTNDIEPPPSPLTIPQKGLESTTETSELQLEVYSPAVADSRIELQAVRDLSLPIPNVPSYPRTNYTQMALHISPYDTFFGKYRRDQIVDSLIDQLKNYDTNCTLHTEQFIAITRRFEAELKQLNGVNEMNEPD